MRNNTVLPKMIDELIEKLEELSDENMGVDDVVRAYDALQGMGNILETITMSKRATRRPLKEELPKSTSYGVVVKQKNLMTWL